MGRKSCTLLGITAVIWTDKKPHLNLLTLFQTPSCLRAFARLFSLLNLCPRWLLLVPQALWGTFPWYGAWARQVFPLYVHLCIYIWTLLTLPQLQLNNYFGHYYLMSPPFQQKLYQSYWLMYLQSTQRRTRTYTEKHFVVVVRSSAVSNCGPTDCSMPGSSIPHYLPEFAPIHAHWVSDAVQPSHPLPPPFPWPSILPSIRVFSNESTLCMRNACHWPTLVFYYNRLLRASQAIQVQWYRPWLNDKSLRSKSWLWIYFTWGYIFPFC